MARVSVSSAVLIGVMTIFFAFSSMAPEASAQGYPGGGGHGGGRGGMRPSQAGTDHSNSAPTQAPADPLETFLGMLHALRMEILVRDDQVERWTSMQDALRAYVDQQRDAGRQLRNPAIDPVLRLRNLADDARARADALQKISDRAAELAKALDDHQRQVFSTRLAEAFSGGTPRTP
jgi:hypothetical protein